MKRFHILRDLPCLFVCAFAARLAVAQLNLSFNPGETAVITLKSGDKFEGRVLGDTPDSVEIEYKLTPKIKDRKTLMKSDIADVTKQSPSETEFAERGLAKLLPTPDLKDASYYESTIQDKLRTFVAKYPGTPESAEVEKIIATLGEEKSKVVSGQLKMEGRWLDAATVKRDGYNIDAYRQFLVMRERASENSDTRHLEALRAFEKLRNGFGASPYFLKAIPDAQEALKKLEAQLGEMIKEVPFLVKRREDGLKQLPANEAPVAKKAIEEEKRAYEEELKRQSADKVKWHDFYKYDAKGIQDILAVIAKSRAELAALDLPALQVESETLMTVIRYIADKNIAEAGAAIEKASKIQNMVNAPLLGKLRAELEKVKKNEQTEQKVMAGSAKAAPPAPKDGDGATVNPTAEVLKKVLEEKQNKKTESAKGPDGKQPAGTAATPPPAVAAPEPEPSLMETVNDYLPVIGGGLLAIIALAWFIGKRKKEKN